MRFGELIAFAIGGVLPWVVGLSITSPPAQESPSAMVRRVCSNCHALQIMGDCVAGDCGGERVVRLLKPPPWDLVLEWMKTIGANMTEAERQAIQVYLQEVYPAKPYSLQWIKVQAHFGEGGWNVVTLKGQGGYLYAGLEGNGKIFRSAQDSGLAWVLQYNWVEVANTNQYTVYGLTTFKKALYAGTHNPLPQIWSSIDGRYWEPVSNLPAEEGGVFSLGVFKGYLYAGGGRARIYRSADGREWELVADLKGVNVPSFIHWIRFLIPFKGYLYAGIEGGPLYRSPEGIQWKVVGRQVTRRAGVRGAAIFKGALFLGTTGGGEIWRSEDGVTWQLVFKASSHVRRGYVASMAVAGDSLFAGIDGYVFRTRDGLSWEEVGHLGPYTIEAMTAFQGAIYAGTLIPPSSHIYKAQLEKAMKGDLP